MCCSGDHKHQSTHSHSLIPWGFGIAASLMLLTAGYHYWTTEKNASAALNYNTEDIATIKPFTTSHQMGVGAPIPFLPKTQPQPKIDIPQTFYNFGSVGPKEVVQKTFIIRNTGQETLTISRAYTTCGCTQAEFSASKIPPGKVALVTVTFDAGFHDSRGMTVQRGVIIENNDSTQPQAEIWVQAYIQRQ